jgi:hypothetical protein
MSARPQDPSVRRAIWWTRSFARPLQNSFTPEDGDMPEEFRDLLEEADQRRKPLDNSMREN